MRVVMDSNVIIRFEYLGLMHISLLLYFFLCQCFHVMAYVLKTFQFVMINIIENVQ